MKSPLHEQHLALKARLVSFAGWEMPLLYRGIIPEHLQTRKNVSIFDICHMGEFELSGPTAEADLEKLLTQSIACIPEWGCGYGYLLNDKGGVLDDLICYRFGTLTAGRFNRQTFWLVVNAATTSTDAEWIKNQLSSTTKFSDLSAETAKLDIQGPRAREEVERALDVKLPDLAYYHFQPLAIDGVECVLSRTGYTGEFGYELYLPVQEAAKFWQKLLAPGVILPAGLGARDTLRVEMGFPLYGHELTDKETPAGAAHGKFIDWNKSFIGKKALLRAQQDQATRRLVGLRLEGRMAARPGDEIFEKGAAVGRVTSGLFAPSLNVAVALGYVERGSAFIGQKLTVRSRGRELKVETVKLPFYTTGTARKNVGREA
jgi:aminomethyltransferase